MTRRLFCVVFFIIMLCYPLSCEPDNNIIMEFGRAEYRGFPTIYQRFKKATLYQMGVQYKLIPWISGEKSYCVVKSVDEGYRFYDPANEEMLLGEVYISTAKKHIIAYSGHKVYYLDYGESLISLMEYNCQTGQNKPYIDALLHSEKERLAYLQMDDRGILYATYVKEEYTYQMQDNGIFYATNEPQGPEQCDIFALVDNEPVLIGRGCLPFWYNDHTIGYICDSHVYLFDYIDRQTWHLRDNRNRLIEIHASPYSTNRVLYDANNHEIIYTVDHDDRALSFLSIVTFNKDIEVLSIIEGKKRIIPIGKDMELVGIGRAL